MRTTLDLPDPLFRRLKARAALEGLSLKDLIARFVIAGLQGTDAPRGDQVSEAASGAGVRAGPFVSAFDVMQDGNGSFRSGKSDLATNPAHLDGFGSD